MRSNSVKPLKWQRRAKFILGKTHRIFFSCLYYLRGMRLKKYTVTQLRDAVSGNFSLRGVLTQLRVSPAGGNYEVLKKAISHYSLDTSHFTGQGWLKGKTCAYRLRPLKEILVSGKLENTYRLKNRLLTGGIKEAKCERCNLTDWMGEPIPLELHHIDGDRKNNELDNLKLLCPNCHAKTGNYRGKNKKV